MHIRQLSSVLLLFALALTAGLAQAGTRTGVPVVGDTAADIPDAPALQRLTFDHFIDFDDMDQPSLFMETYALTVLYASEGVVFSGPAPGDGAGILNENGLFDVYGHSSPNFLACNCEAYFGDGGIPQGPERLDFTTPVSTVSALVGVGFDLGGSLTLDAYDADDVLIATQTVALESAMQEIAVVAEGIAYVIFDDADACIWVLDDLGFNGGTVAAEGKTWSGVKSLFR